MRRWTIWLIVGVVLALFFGGYGVSRAHEDNHLYQLAMEKAKQNIKKSKYRKAELNYQDALKKKKKSTEAKMSLYQLREYRKALKKSQMKEFKSARKEFIKIAKIDGGSSEIVKMATIKQTELKEVIKERKVFQAAYVRAKTFSRHHEYTASNQKLAVILGYGSIKESYYDDIYKQAKSLEKKNNQTLKMLGYTTTSSSDSDDDQAITPEDLLDAREDLQRAGLPVKPDKELKELIVKARKDQKTVVEVLQAEAKEKVSE